MNCTVRRRGVVQRAIRLREQGTRPVALRPRASRAGPPRFRTRRRPWPTRLPTTASRASASSPRRWPAERAGGQRSTTTLAMFGPSLASAKTGACADPAWPKVSFLRGSTRTNTVPRGLSRDDVRRLLGSTEGERQVDKRDRAILMLLIGYRRRVCNPVRWAQAAMGRAVRISGYASLGRAWEEAGLRGQTRQHGERT